MVERPERGAQRAAGTGQDRVLQTRRAFLERALDELEPVLAPEDLAVDDIAGRAEHVARPGLLRISIVLSPNRVRLRRSRQLPGVHALFLADRGEGFSIGDVALLRPAGAQYRTG